MSSVRSTKRLTEASDDIRVECLHAAPQTKWSHQLKWDLTVYSGHFCCLLCHLLKRWQINKAYTHMHTQGHFNPLSSWPCETWKSVLNQQKPSIAPRVPMLRSVCVLPSNTPTQRKTHNLHDMIVLVYNIRYIITILLNWILILQCTMEIKRIKLRLSQHIYTVCVCVIACGRSAGFFGVCQCDQSHSRGPARWC